MAQAYHYLKSSKKKFFWGGFTKACITKAAKEAHSLIKVCQNPFEEIQISL